MVAIGVGCIKGTVTTTDEGKNIDISFNDVLLVPCGLGRNLLSVTRLVDRGGQVTFGRSGAFIKQR